MPKHRRDGREAALQFLFGHELNAGELDDVLPMFWNLRLIRPKAREFAEQLVRGLAAHREQVDQAIAAALENYQLHRLSSVDRNLLRLATHEMLFETSTPVPVVLNEAIEIAKRFGGEESARFVNGVLDRIRREAAAPAPGQPGEAPGSSEAARSDESDKSDPSDS